MNAIVKSLGCLTLATLLSFTAVAGEPTPEQTKGRYRVYAWSCSRSVRLILTTDNVQEAQAAAEKALQGNRKSQVTTGTHERFWPFDTPVGYEVHQPGCKGSWKLADTVKVQSELAACVDRVVKESGRAIVVAVY